jgi:hypothetical protein
MTGSPWQEKAEGSWVEGSIIIRGRVTEGRLFGGAVAEGAWQRASVWRA